MPKTGTDVSIQRVDSPIITRNLDATKIQARPPSSCISRPILKSRNERFREISENGENLSQNPAIKKVDLTHRNGFFCGTSKTINSRLIYLSDIGRCDLYGKSAKRLSGDDSKILKLQNSSSDLTRWITLSNEEFKKKQRARLASNEPRLIETYISTTLRVNRPRLGPENRRTRWGKTSSEGSAGSPFKQKS